MEPVDRATRMARRVAETAEALGLEPEARGLIEVAHALAMEPRLAAIHDDHDPRYLHPGRCAVIVMDDLEVPDPVLIAATSLVETEVADLAVPADRIAAHVSPQVAELAAAVPGPGDPGLAEALVLSERPVRLAALVERLDQLRHAHLWDDMERRRAAHALAVEVYAPVAERTHPLLARRYRWWCGMFAKRYLKA